MGAWSARSLSTTFRAVPPLAPIAWFLHDLIPDAHWRDFDLGAVRSTQLDIVRQAIYRHGGRDAWLRFIEETRRSLPHLLAVPIVDILHCVHEEDPSSQRAWLIHRPSLDVYIGGRQVETPIDFGIFGYFEALRAPHSPHSTRSTHYALYETEIEIMHLGEPVQRSSGRYYLPLPD
jgi:hypothetical protein